MNDSQPTCQYRVYLWELPVRINHWTNVLCIITLTLTGLYIGSPRTLGLTASSYVMGWVRLVHFIAGYLFAVSVAMRVYWSLAGNRYASWRGFFPFLTAAGRRQMVEVFRYYTFLSPKVPETEGHNPLAASAYVAVFFCYLTMLATGFALYAQHAPGGILHRLMTPLYLLFSTPGIRLTHHLVMWLILGFVINHIYSAWLMDLKERCGEMSSIFSGAKFIHRRGK
jgi:Ni/Fe-hydrogenase 1 B-type cytochrome subunit